MSITMKSFEAKDGIGRPCSVSVEWHLFGGYSWSYVVQADGVQHWVYSKANYASAATAEKAVRRWLKTHS